MNLGVIETHLLRALRQQWPDGPDLHAGPAYAGPASGVRAQVFVHAAGLADLGGVTAEGAAVARQPLQAAPGLSGFVEQRPAQIDIEVSCVCAQHAPAQRLAGLVAPTLLQALETMLPALLSDPADGTRRLLFGDHRSHVHAASSVRELHDGVPVYRAVLVLRLDGFLRVELAAPGGLQRRSLFADSVPSLEVCWAPAGNDLQREHVRLRNSIETTIDLAGWTIHDAARRPHRYRFPSLCLLAPGAELKLWSGRGQDDAANLYWGRRQAVWTNTGDAAMLLDPEGIERARAEFRPPQAPRGRTPKRR
jgi:hypothetical protein